MDIRWTWTAPIVDAEHGTAYGYQLEVNPANTGWILATETPDTTVTVPMPDGTSIVRVRAWNLDPFGDRRYGPYSASSDPVTIQPAPGGCGTPIATAAR